MGVGQARNRVQAAVERTVPFGMLTMSLVYLWYALHGHHPDDVTDRRTAPLVHHEGRTVLRGHARQAPPDHPRHPIHARTPSSTHPRRNHRGPPGLDTSSRVGAKVE
jgi:hypothetical protein